MKYLIPIIAVLVLTISGGYSDARGFIYASEIWQDGEMNWRPLLKAAGSFGVGIVTYLALMRFLPQLGIALSAEIQTVSWFTVTLIIVALSSGEFFKWPTLDKLVAVFLMIGLGWLFTRGH